MKKKKREKAGRPLKLELDPELADRMATIFGTGLSLTDTARACEIDPSTIWRWWKAGKADPDGPFGSFARLMREGEGKALAAATLRVVNSKDVGDLKWWLANRRPGRFGKARQVQVLGHDGGAIKHELKVTDEQQDEALDKILASLKD